MNKISTKELKELLVAVAKLVASYNRAKADDGKVGALEAVRLIMGNASDLISGVTGVQEVPKELKDITPEELDELRFAVCAALEWAPTPGALAQFDLVYDLVRHILHVVREMANFVKPPKAEVVAE